MQADLSPLNQRELSKLIISIRANAHHLDLFLAVCDDRELQDLLIQQYETTLANEGFAPYRVGLNPKAPSLKATLDEFVKYNPALQSDTKVVVTVLGSSSLFGVRLTEDKSEQEKFFFLCNGLGKPYGSLNFQWCSGFLIQWLQGYLSKPRIFGVGAVVCLSLKLNPMVLNDLPYPCSLAIMFPANLSQAILETSSHTVADLLQQINELRHQNPQSPLLTTLYSQLGDAHSSAICL